MVTLLAGGGMVLVVLVPSTSPLLPTSLWGGSRIQRTGVVGYGAWVRCDVVRA